MGSKKKNQKETQKYSDAIKKVLKLKNKNLFTN